MSGPGQGEGGSGSIDWAEVERLAAERFGIEAFRPGQRELIGAVLAGRDALGILPTGAGKSLTFQLPALLLPGTVVVVSPLIALMQDQHAKMSEADVDVQRLDSSLTASEARAAEHAVARGRADLVYVTPERLTHPEHLEVLKRSKVGLLVVDEAHCVSQWGHDFRPAYLELRQAIRELGRPPVLALTATSPPAVRDDIVRQLALEDPVLVNGGIDRENLSFEVRPCVNREAKERHLLELLRARHGPAVIYVATTKRVDELHRWLVAQGVDAVRYHGKMRMREREASQEAFMRGEKEVIAATNAFGLGVDKPDIRTVVHWNFPDSLESYYQEAGRAGRDGQPARAFLLYRLEDRRIHGFFNGGKYPKRDDLLALYGALGRVGEEGATAGELAAAVGIPARRAAVVAALMEGMGLARWKGRRLVPARAFADGDELTAFLTEYDGRRDADRARLAAMMKYAQGGRCRLQSLRDYFGEHEGERCGTCDRCDGGLGDPRRKAEPTRAGLDPGRLARAALLEAVEP